MFWIGLKSNSFGTWSWESGQLLTVNDWQEDVNAGSSVNKCAKAAGKSGWLVDSCSSSLSFVCQM